MLPPIKDVIRTHGLQADKSLGQHFIHDLNITDRVARSAGIIKDQHILEIGPGPGALTRAILAHDPATLTAVEKDSRCLAALADIQKEHPQLNVIEGDALHYAPDSRTKIIANLPYNIGTELILRWLETPELYESITVMLQKEVAERIAAQPGSKAYGRLAIFCQWLCDVDLHFHLPPEAFIPPPKIWSSVITLTPLNEPRYACDAAALKTLTTLLFNQRRKQLKAILKKIDGAAEVIESLGLDPTARPENVSIEQMCQLATSLQPALQQNR